MLVGVFHALNCQICPNHHTLIASTGAKISATFWPYPFYASAVKQDQTASTPRSTAMVQSHAQIQVWMSLQGGQWPIGCTSGPAGSSVRGCCIVSATEKRKRDVMGLTRKAVMGKAAWDRWTNIRDGFKDCSAYLADSQTRNTALWEGSVSWAEKQISFAEGCTGNRNYWISAHQGSTTQYVQPLQQALR